MNHAPRLIHPLCLGPSPRVPFSFCSPLLDTLLAVWRRRNHCMDIRRQTLRGDGKAPSLRQCLDTRHCSFSEGCSFRETVWGRRPGLGWGNLGSPPEDIRKPEPWAGFPQVVLNGCGQVTQYWKSKHTPHRMGVEEGGGARICSSQPVRFSHTQDTHPSGQAPRRSTPTQSLWSLQPCLRRLLLTAPREACGGEMGNVYRDEKPPWDHWSLGKLG